MCGIIGYTGYQNASGVIINGLKRLEYRGYDSWGLGIPAGEGIKVTKKVGRIGSISAAGLQTPGSGIGIGHTRWATTGRVSEGNAHPFTDCKDLFAVVHNGIIENYLQLKEELRMQGVQFSSETDSEVIVHLVQQYYAGDLLQAVQQSVQRLSGSYAFCIIKHDTNEIVGARNGSPLIVGLGKNENILASDVAALIEHTRRVMYLRDFQLVRITPASVEVFDFQGTPSSVEVREVNWDLEQAQKQGYKHFMLKEIFEQPRVAETSLSIPIPLPRPARIIIVACGTAYYAGMVGKCLMEQIAKLPVTVEIASEFRYQEPLFPRDSLVLAISQSGETADTLAAIRLARERGCPTAGIINVADSTLAREVETVLYTKAGPEIGVASTKAFMAQLAVLYAMACHFSGKPPAAPLAGILEQVLGLSEKIRSLAQKYCQYRSFLFVGRGLHYPLALEGALKLKEISYIHAEAYPAGELKHGPLALVSEDMPVVALCPRDAVYEKTLNNIEEVKARQGKVIALATEGDRRVSGIADDVLYVPAVAEMLYPLVLAVPLQLLAYHIADIKECDVDKPRNLAKSVTVE